MWEKIMFKQWIWYLFALHNEERIRQFGWWKLPWKFIKIKIKGWHQFQPDILIEIGACHFHTNWNGNCGLEIWNLLFDSIAFFMNFNTNIERFYMSVYRMDEKCTKRWIFIELCVKTENKCQIPPLKTFDDFLKIEKIQGFSVFKHIFSPHFEPYYRSKFLCIHDTFPMGRKRNARYRKLHVRDSQTRIVSEKVCAEWLLTF